MTLGKPGWQIKDLIAMDWVLSRESMDIVVDYRLESISMHKPMTLLLSTGFGIIILLPHGELCAEVLFLIMYTRMAC